MAILEDVALVCVYMAPIWFIVGGAAALEALCDHWKPANDFVEWMIDRMTITDDEYDEED